VSVAILVVLVAATVIAALVFPIDASPLRAPIARYVSARLDRPVLLGGKLKLSLRHGLRVEIQDLALGNARWGSRPAMLRVERAVIRIRLLPLLRGRIVLPEVELTKPDILLERSAEHGPNWQFGRRASAASTGSVSTGRWSAPEIHTLLIKEGTLQFRDPVVGSDVVLTIDSTRVGRNDAAIGFVGHGSLRGGTFELEGSAASLLELQEGGKPYRLNVKARAGATKAAFDGSVVPPKLETIDGRLELSGRDLSELYPLAPVPLPWTSSYRISGHFLREGRKYSLRDLNGRVGGSDIRGSAAIDLGGKRPLLTGTLASRRLDYKDLAGFLGAPPPAKGRPRPPAQQREVEELRDTGRVLSDKPYNLARLRAVDARVRFNADSILARGLPLDDMSANLRLTNGMLVLAPLNFGVAGGRVISTIKLDARRHVIDSTVEATATDLEAKELLPTLKRSPGSAGKVGGRAALSVTGNSMASMAASANGEIALIMSQGRASTLALVLVNLDLANAAKYIHGDANAPVHCAVISAKVQGGRATPDVFVVDSSVERITGEGNVDFGSERYDLRLIADSKRASLLALRGPISIGGTFKHPKVQPEIGPVALRAGAAIALGFLAPPLALLPLVDPGNAKGVNCTSLIGQATKEAPAR
jgi:uncharacterized protein involved in outer membrane biogenesis